MKGIIVDKNSESLVLLLSDGTFRNVKGDKNAEIGSVVLFREEAGAAFVKIKKLAVAAAALFLVAFLGTGVYAWTTPVQYINIDINPSVELSVNRFDRIIKTTPMDEEGKKLLESVSVHAEKYESGVSKVIDTAKALGYLEDEGDILISVSSADDLRREKASSLIKEKVDKKVEVLTFDAASHDVSVKNGISPGKSNIIEKVIENGADLSREELTNFSVKELLEKIKENRSNEKEQKKEQKEKEKQKEQEEKSKKQKSEKQKDQEESKIQKAEKQKEQEESKKQKTEKHKDQEGLKKQNSEKPAEEQKSEKKKAENQNAQEESKGQKDKKQEKEQDNIFLKLNNEWKKLLQTKESGASGSVEEKAANEKDKSKASDKAGTKDNKKNEKKDSKNPSKDGNKKEDENRKNDNDSSKVKNGKEQEKNIKNKEENIEKKKQNRNQNH